MIKRAQLEGLGSTLFAVSVLTGVPVGIVAHTLGNKVKKTRKDEAELDEMSERYLDAAKALRERKMFNLGRANYA